VQFDKFHFGGILFSSGCRAINTNESGILYRNPQAKPSAPLARAKMRIATVNRPSLHWITCRNTSASVRTTSSWRSALDSAVWEACWPYIKEGFRILKLGGRMLVDNVNLLSELGWKFFEELRAIPPDQRPPHISKTSTPQEQETYFRRAGFHRIEQAQFDLWIVTYGVKPDAAPTLQ
jgi:hypothetical protein